MTEVIVSRGDTFPRSFLDTYRTTKRASRATEDFYSELKSSKSDELVLQNDVDIPMANDIYHGHSESLLDTSGNMSPTEGNFLDKIDVMTLPHRHHRRVTVYDRVDPEDSIRDIVTENDFYKFVLFKKHYDKYLHLSQKYEEARNIAYYLEEKYHEVKTERDGLILQRDRLSKRIESSESLIKEKEDEVFIQLERVVFLEEQCDKLKVEKDKYLLQKLQIEKERDEALKLLKEQAKESEVTRRKLEKARQEVFTHMNKMKCEKDFLERENDQLKETLEAERKGMEKYISTLQRKKAPKSTDYCTARVTDVDLEGYQQNSALSSQFQKALRHLATCKMRKCSVCSYTKAAFGLPKSPKYEKRLLSCLQTPFLEMRNMLKPPPSPISCEGASLSEWFRPLDCPNHNSSECSSLSIPFAELAISYMDDTSDTASNFQELDEIDKEQDFSRASQACGSFRGFGSDSGFASDFCPEYKSNTTTPKDKFSPKSTLDEADCAKLTRTKWTASFRRLINRIKK